MSNTQRLLVGFDLCNDYSQIACYNLSTFEPESIYLTKDQSKYLIPTVLGVTENTKDWVYGEEAIQLGNIGKAVLIEELLQRIINKENTIIHEVSFTGTDLLERYLRKCLTLLKQYYPNESIQKIVFTLKDQNPLLREALYTALGGLGINRDRINIISHSQSYLYYALSQKKELWMNDVGLFDFDETGVHYSQLSINRKFNPMIVGTKEKDFSNTLSFQLLENSQKKESLCYLMEDITKIALHKQIISTVYFTGKGFEGNWADEVLAGLCTNRRVFKGQNLYARGACYMARELTREEKKNDFLFLSEEMIASDIVVNVYNNAMMTEVYLAKAGIPWFESKNQLDLILDEEQEIEIITRKIIKSEETRQMITLDGLSNKPNKTTRVQVRASFLDAKSCVITIKDIGFGEFYPSSNRIWEKVILLE